MDPDKHPWTGEEIWIQILKLIFFSTGKEPPNFLFIPFLRSLTKQYFSGHVNFIYWLPSNCMVSNWTVLQDWKWSADCSTCRWVFQRCAAPAVRADCSQMPAVWRGGIQPSGVKRVLRKEPLSSVGSLGKGARTKRFLGRMSLLLTAHCLDGLCLWLSDDIEVLVVIEISICSCWAPAELCYLSLTLDEN